MIPLDTRPTRPRPTWVRKMMLILFVIAIGHYLFVAAALTLMHPGLMSGMLLSGLLAVLCVPHLW